jgi:hypothetical protein
VRLNGAAIALTLASGAKASKLRDRCDALQTALGLMELSGMLQKVMEMTAEYISNRVQFGQPIAKFGRRGAAADIGAAQSTLGRLPRDLALSAIQTRANCNWRRRGDQGLAQGVRVDAPAAAASAWAWSTAAPTRRALTGSPRANGSINEMIGRTLDGLGLKGRVSGWRSRVSIKTPLG